MNSSTNPTPFPRAAGLELPILHELRATGGEDQVTALALRLLRHFPALSPRLDPDAQRRFLRLLRRAGAALQARGELSRSPKSWSLTDKGRRRAAAEDLRPDPSPPGAATPDPVSHQQAQDLLLDIGRWLGRHAEAEFQHYDVVWRSCPGAPRLSHVFEVQVAGSVDGALARLKQAHETQRSRLYLIVASERDARFAQARLRAAFPEIARHVGLVGIGQLQRLHQSLQREADLLAALAHLD